MKLVDKLGVQSYCYRNIKDVAAMTAEVKATGVNRIELCESHIDFSDISAHAPTIKTITENGVKIVSTGVNTVFADEARSRPRFEFLKASGAKMMSVVFLINELPDALRTAEKLAEEYDVKLGIHNHGGYHWLGNVETLSWIYKQTSERIGLTLDTAWAMHTGESVRNYINSAGKRLFALHFKDFTFKPNGRWQDVPTGTGNLNLKDLKQWLEDVEFSGEPILEFEGDPTNPAPALKKCIDNIRATMA